MQLPLYATLLAFVVLAALISVLLRDVLSAIIALAGFSFGAALVYVLLSAPDVALTEAAVGAGATTVLFLVTIVKTVRPPGDRIFEQIRWGPAALATALFGGLLLTLPSLPRLGDPNSPVVGGDVTRYYLENAYPETGVENVVTAVLAAYRGFDTLGEATVVIAAGIAVLLVLRREVYV
jgi:multicomponent Na+:H+ antiporter subunit B